MEENTNVQTMDEELTFDPADFPEYEDDGNHTEETETTEEQPAEEVSTETTEPTTETTEPTETAEQQAETKPEPFVPVKFMGEPKNLTIEEASVWAQKGMNYDRVVQQRDELQQFRTTHEPLVSDLGRIAQMFGLEPAAMLDQMEENLLRQQGKTDAEAKAIVRANKIERQLQGYQTQEQRVRQQQEEAQQRQQRDFREFVQRYPGLDPKTIPASVWQDVHKGEPLVQAYGRYEMQQLKAENQRLQQQLSAQKQNKENKQKSLGSMQSGSATPKLDDFLRGFNDE